MSSCSPDGAADIPDMTADAAHRPAAIRLAGLECRHGGTAILGPIDLAIARGSFVALVGASGSGKSTLIRSITHLHVPSAGTVEVDGTDVGGVDVARLRRRIGYVFQSVGLFPHMDVAANIGIGARIGGGQLAVGRVEELLALVGLDPSFATRMPASLSGGQAQRVGVARALALEPAIMLMDEPFGALDPVTRDRLAREMREVHDRLGLTTLMVTHDMAEALLVADRILVLDAGRIVADASPAVLIANPGHPAAEALVAVPRAQAAAIAALAGPDA
jgi:osmoprotectant transport system ATP-binding protein